MSTNDANNPMNTGTGAGSNYGTSNTGTGLGNSGNLSNDSTSYSAGRDYDTTDSGAAAAADDVANPTAGRPGDEIGAQFAARDDVDRKRQAIGRA